MTGGDDGEISSIPAVTETEQLEAAPRVTAEFDFLSQDKTREQLMREKTVNEHNRDQRFKQAFEDVAIWAMRAMAIALLFCGVVWLFNLLLPTDRRWLDCEQMSKLQDILTGGLLAGLIVDHFRRRLQPEPHHTDPSRR